MKIPTDEDIEEMIHSSFVEYEGMYAWAKGAKWMRDHLKEREIKLVEFAVKSGLSDGKEIIAEFERAA